MGKAETRLTDHMRKDGTAAYGERLVIVKYHGDQYARAGVSDLLFSLDGVFGACEVKAPESYGDSPVRALRDGPTVKQREFVRKVNTSGGVGWFAATREHFMAGLRYIEWLACSACMEPDQRCPTHDLSTYPYCIHPLNLDVYGEE